MTTIESPLVPGLVASDFDSFAVRQAMAGFLGGFGESTRDAYSLDLRQWMRWCASHDLGIFEVRWAHIELFARWLEQEGKAVGLDRNEQGMFLVQAGLAGGRDHALACLLALNGLRISEALNADIEHLVWNVATAP